MTVEPSLGDLAREARLPRNLILADRDGAPAEDLRDCARLLVSAGFDAAAIRLDDAATLVAGAPLEPTPMQGSTWDIAVGDVSDLIAVAEEETRPAQARDAMRLALGSSSSEQDGAPPPDDDWMAAEFPRASSALLGLRRRASTLSTAATHALVETAFRSGPFDLSTLSRNPERLATALAFNVTRRVLIRRGELLRSPYGGFAIFERCERLSAHGLGLGFQNVGPVASTWSDIGLLISEAWRRAPRRSDLSDTMDRFTVLLSGGLPHSAQRTLVGTLADAGRVPILTGMLIRLQRAPADRVDPDLLRDLRDAFLDLGRLRLAAATQGRLTAVTENHPAERAAQDELEAAWRHQRELSSATDRPARRIVRRSGFGGSAAARWRRYAHGSDSGIQEATPRASG